MITFSTQNFGIENAVKTTVVVNSNRPELQVVMTYRNSSTIHCSLNVMLNGKWTLYYSSFFFSKTESEIESLVVNALNINKKHIFSFAKSQKKAA